ncbi:MAG: PIN domain-containing protein [Gemmatimonadales bacterium]
MLAVGLKVLKNKLAEYVRLVAAGETVLVTDRERVVAELIPPRTGRSDMASDALLAEAVRKGWVTPPVVGPVEPPAGRPVAPLRDLLAELDEDRAGPDLPRHVGGARSAAGGRPRPSAALWEQPMVTSRLLEYELWTRLNGRGLGASHRALAEALLARLAFVELLRPVLVRAVEPFPTPVRTLDALHLASMEFLRRAGQAITLASYDSRLTAAAARLGVDAVKLD